MYTDHEKPFEPSKPLRFACVACDKLFNDKTECLRHVIKEHIDAIARVHVRATYREERLKDGTK